MKLAKVLIPTIVGLVLLIIGLAALKVGQFKAMGAGGQAGKSETVTAFSVTEEQWAPTLEAVGSLVAYQGVVVTTETSGIVSAIHFSPGSFAKAGDLLVSLDTSVLDPQLAAAEARAELARLNAERARELFAGNHSARAELDGAEAQLKQGMAELAAIRAQIAQKQVRAPFAGRLGIRQINVGQYIDRGNPLVSLQALDPVYVNFTLPQQKLAQLEVGMRVRVTVDAMPGEIFEGSLTAVNPDVDASTRNVRVQATLDNRAEKLRPGMFVRAEVVLPRKEKVLVIPASSVLYAPFGDSVFVIDKAPSGSLVLRQQFIRLGRSRGDFVVVESGLASGQSVVSTGVFKFRNGTQVRIDNKLAPTPSLNPTPENS